MLRTSQRIPQRIPLPEDKKEQQLLERRQLMEAHQALVAAQGPMVAQTLALNPLPGPLFQAHRRRALLLSLLRRLLQSNL